MTQHISVRVPWHDNNWNGHVCQDPCGNNSCLKLKNIFEKKNDVAEAKICGQCMVGKEQEFSCIGEGSAFMSAQDLICKKTHPNKNKDTHSHFLETEVVYPAYSFPSCPYRWMTKDKISEKIEAYGIEYHPDKEPLLSFKSKWIQEATNHKAIFDCFYGDVQNDKSLVIAYAKQVPFVENSRRVIVAVGHVKRIVKAVEYKRSNPNLFGSMTWATHICHSIRMDHKDGFIIPYKEMMEYAQLHPNFDINSIVVYAPEDAFEEFSYSSEWVSYDSVINVILSCIKAFDIINQCLDEDYSNVLQWLNERLSDVWKERGAFPGLGAMLTALEIPMGVLIAKEINEKLPENVDIWEQVNMAFTLPEKILSSRLALKITSLMKNTWKAMPEERKALFKLLSRLAISIAQAKLLFNEREKNGINCSDKDILDNLYILYEKTRLMQEPLLISIQKVDRAVFPLPSILEKYPLVKPVALESENDQRRIRAIAISVLEQAAIDGHTFLPCTQLVDRICELTLDHKCRVTMDILVAVADFIKPEILKREMKNGEEYYKLVRIQNYDDIIEKRVSKRLAAQSLNIKADWRNLLDNKFNDLAKTHDIDEQEERARREKAACLEQLANSKISVLVGDAGTGKTTVLSVLCSHPDIKAGGVLLLAPTGKATVRLLESMGEDGKSFTALNIAQFLMSSKRFNIYSMRYVLNDEPYNDIPETVIIDEASMLTEEMFGALMQALKNAKRIIFVGDPNQLPPIGAGRPFVDLVMMLRKKLKARDFPRVCTHYGELTINRRQKADDIRMDVRLSKLFTSSEYTSDDDVIAEIEKGNNPNIIIEHWTTKEELEDKILSAIVAVTGMRNVDDQAGFDLSLGGYSQKGMIYFNLGAASSVEKWQILAPVRNMSQGVMNINRLIHLKYRKKFLDLSKNNYKKHIAAPLGPEGIVYGDKVINVVNTKKDAYLKNGDRNYIAREWYLKNGARNYIANGEIGIACDDFYHQRDYGDNNMHVEFSSQKGYKYSFNSSDFDEERENESLELAYALTVHKAQGSQFNTVILVLAEPCCIISKEMLYTALTRQLDRIIILYNKESYHLRKYASPANSAIATRFTDLFADVFKDTGDEYRPQIVCVKDQFYEERLIHKTAHGELVRSKSEVVIADALYHLGVDYEYEAELTLEGKKKYPDFKIVDSDTEEVWYWEHCGMMTDPLYKKYWEDKKQFYAKNGIIEGKNLIITYDDENGGLDSSKIEQKIRDTFA